MIIFAFDTKPFISHSSNNFKLKTTNKRATGLEKFGITTKDLGKKVYGQHCILLK